MTIEMTAMSTKPGNVWRSIGAILLGIALVVVLSLATDQVFHVLEVYPPWGKPMYESGLLVLALAYRCVFNVVGAYVTAKVAPRNPMRHVWILAFIGLALGIIGAVATIPMKMGPAWYPISLAVTAIPFTWLGGTLHRKWSGGR